MSTNQGLRQAVIRASTGTALDYNGDWMAKFTADGIADGPFNQRFVAWLQTKLDSSNTNLDGLKDAYATTKGAGSWNELGTFVISIPATVHIPSTSGDWTGATGSWTIATGAVSSPADNAAMYANFTLEGDFNVSFQVDNKSGAANGVFATSEVGTFDPVGQGALSSMTNSYFHNGGGSDCRYGGDGANNNVAPITNGQTVRFTRQSGVIKVYVDDVLKHTYPTSYSDDMYYSVGAGSTVVAMSSIELTSNWAG